MRTTKAMNLFHVVIDHLHHLLLASICETTFILCLSFSNFEIFIQNKVEKVEHQLFYLSIPYSTDVVFISMVFLCFRFVRGGKPLKTGYELSTSIILNEQFTCSLQRNNFLDTLSSLITLHLRNSNNG